MSLARQLSTFLEDRSKERGGKSAEEETHLYSQKDSNYEQPCRTELLKELVENIRYSQTHFILKTQHELSLHMKKEENKEEKR